MADQKVVITPYPDGPFLVRGPVVLEDQNGDRIGSERRVVALCRCGRSRIRPFCDGTHHLIRFRAPGGAEDRQAGAEDREAGAEDRQTAAEDRRAC